MQLIFHGLSLAAASAAMKPADSCGQAIYQEQLKRYLQFPSEVMSARKAT